MYVVRETWYQELKSPTTFYTAVTDLQFFNHLISNCGDLHETVAVTIQASMVKFYNEAKGIPQYIRLVPAQYGPFFYMRSHLSALQNCALIFSTNFHFIFTFKK